MNNTQHLIKITEDLRRAQTTSTFCEELNFRSDSGYDLNTLYRRALAVLERCFQQGPGSNLEVGFTLSQLPVFQPHNRMRITVEILEPDAPQQTQKSQLTDKQSN